MPSALNVANYLPESMIVIYDSTLTADAANFDVQNIPQGYKHLMIIASLRTSEATLISNALGIFNNDSGSNYDTEGVRSRDSTVTGTESQAGANFSFITPGANTAAGVASVVQAFIPDYAGTVFEKSMSVTGTFADEATTGGDAGVRINHWRSTAAINRITLTGQGGSNFKAGSRLTIYGLGGAQLYSNAGPGYSPLDTLPSSPNSFDDEFTDSSTLSNWTTYGDARDTEDINTTVPGRLYFTRTTDSFAKISGRYKAISTTGTYICALGRSSYAANGRGGGIVILPTGTISDASPVVYWGWCQDVQIIRHSALATWAANVNSFSASSLPKVYLRLKFNSATSVDMDFSLDGVMWSNLMAAYNPGWNMDKVGWGISTEGVSTDSLCTIDWFRKTA